MPRAGADFLDAAERVDDLRDDLEENLEDGVEDEMGIVALELRRTIRRKDLVARGVDGGLLGKLLNDPVTRTTDPNQITRQVIEIPDQYAYIERGTGKFGPYKAPDPGPPLEKILTWIVEKGVTPTEYETQYGLAKAIQETIGDVGNRPNPFVSPTWRGPRGRSSVRRRAGREMSRSVRQNNLS